MFCHMLLCVVIYKDILSYVGIFYHMLSYFIICCHILSYVVIYAFYKEPTCKELILLTERKLRNFSIIEFL